MSYLLDTNTCIRYLNGSSINVLRKMQTVSNTDIFVCSVVKAELFYGAMKSNKSTQTLAKQQAFLSQFVSLPFDDKAANKYGRIRAELARLGTPIGPNDLMIAAIALANNLTLITHNLREFSRITGLNLEDWETTP
jgi:tRNA(fMet)-specific endonuclease VapC